MSAAAGRAAATSHTQLPDVEPWPRGVSREPKYGIGKVTQILKQEFPALAQTKIRFIEKQGIISPQRTNSGYRKFSDADIERIRFGLRVQRDTYTPWEEIRQMLRAMDRGEEIKAQPTARLVACNGQVVGTIAPGALLSRRELLDYTGVDEHYLGQLEAAKLVAADPAGLFPSEAIAVVGTAAKLHHSGIPARNLAYLAVNARRNITLIKQVTPAAKPHQDAVAKESRLAHATDLGMLIAALATQLLQLELGQMD